MSDLVLKSSMMDSIFMYLKERLTFFPWLVMPAFILVLGHSENEYRYILLYNLMLAVFFFRSLDDYFCWSYDLRNKKHMYHCREKKDVLFLMVLCSFLYLSSLILIFPFLIFGINMIVIAVSIILYIGLKTKKSILFISLLKYPLLMYMVASYSDEMNFIWVFIVSTFFIAREVLEEYFGKRNKKIELILLVLFLSTKLSMRLL